ncbi:MAG: 3-methyladenine DNA glycosylase [Gemmatimonadetes bacterium GWC2_71_10]|nr:MAG: 3-methyladenine DNA glycosylase [Gemmatimonadetes bacterium GWC2_71_10]
MTRSRLPRSFYARDAKTVAQDLLGRLIVSTVDGSRCVARVVETEAYLGPHDPASHAAGGRRTARNEVMYGAPGRAYVYFTYGMHWCFNVVTDRAGFPGAVLIRAAEPLEGLDVMRRRRGALADRLLAAGPARLAQALGIARDHNGHALTQAPLWLADAEPVPARRRVSSPRVGIREAVDWPLRFYEKGSEFVSRA